MDAEGPLVLADVIETHRPQRLPEIGSGGSSSWIGEFVRRHGGSVISLEHQPEYAAEDDANGQLVGPPGHCEGAAGMPRAGNLW